MELNIQESTQLLSRLQQDFNDLFRHPSERSNSVAKNHSTAVSGRWISPINIHQADSQFFVSVNTPGINIRDMEIDIENGILSIKAEPKLKNDRGCANQYPNASARGTFHRRFRLPESADPDQITSKSRDGVLTITLGKRDMSTSKLINS